MCNCGKGVAEKRARQEAARQIRAERRVAEQQAREQRRQAALQPKGR